MSTAKQLYYKIHVYSHTHEYVLRKVMAPFNERIFSDREPLINTTEDYHSLLLLDTSKLYTLKFLNLKQRTCTQIRTHNK